MSDVLELHQGWNSLAAAALDAYMPDGVPEAELAFHERRIRENGGPAPDQACGTGRHIFPLLARGLEVHVHRETWYDHAELVALLESAGYSDARTYGDYTDEPAMAGSQSVIYGAGR